VVVVRLVFGFLTGFRWVVWLVTLGRRLGGVTRHRQWALKGQEACLARTHEWIDDATKTLRDSMHDILDRSAVNLLFAHLSSRGHNRVVTDPGFERAKRRIGTDTQHAAADAAGRLLARLHSAPTETTAEQVGRLVEELSQNCCERVASSIATRAEVLCGHAGLPSMDSHAMLLELRNSAKPTVAQHADRFVSDWHELRRSYTALKEAEHGIERYWKECSARWAQRNTGRRHTWLRLLWHLVRSSK
jgi:hypothetical protein